MLHTWSIAAAMLLGTLVQTASAAGPTTNAPSDLFKFRRLDLAPPAAPVRILPIAFPHDEPFRRIAQLVWLEGRIWFTAEPRESATNGLQPQLWGFSPSANRIERVEGILADYHPSALFPHGRELWLAVEGGAGAFHAATFSVEGFNALQGLTTPHLVGFAEVDARLVALGSSGIAFTLDARGTNWTRLGNAAPGSQDRLLDPWRFIAGSGTWMLAGSSNRIVARHLHAPEWVDHTPALRKGCPSASPGAFRCATGDGKGGFWIGSDAGLHHLDADSGLTLHHWVTPDLTIPAPPVSTGSTWHRPSAAAVAEAREQLITRLRTRMRDRARLVRAATPGTPPPDPATPSSRLPGGVQAVFRDKTLLWIAAWESPTSGRTRVLAYETESRRWLGSFHLPLPVSSLALHDGWLYAAGDASHLTRGMPFLMADTRGITGIPARQWLPDRPGTNELQRLLASRTPRERAIHHFFANQPQASLDLLRSSTQDRPPTDEALFLLAFCHDSIGLDQPAELHQFLRRLHDAHPESPFAEATRSMLDGPAPKSPTEPRPPGPETGTPNLSEILARRDLDGDGRISAVELKLWLGDRIQLPEFDRSGNGTIEPDELPRLLERLGGR